MSHNNAGEAIFVGCVPWLTSNSEDIHRWARQILRCPLLLVAHRCMSVRVRIQARALKRLIFVTIEKGRRKVVRRLILPSLAGIPLSVCHSSCSALSYLVLKPSKSHRVPGVMVVALWIWKRDAPIMISVWATSRHSRY